MVTTERRRQVHGKQGRHVRRPAIHGVHIATAREGKELFDHQAKKTLGISGDEFLKRWDAGEYRGLNDAPEGRKVRRLVMLLPFARRTTR